MRVGVLTGGGDCPGLNAVIRAVARRSFAREHEVVGVLDGWRGLVEGVFTPLGPREVLVLPTAGGTRPAERDAERAHADERDRVRAIAPDLRQDAAGAAAQLVRVELVRARRGAVHEVRDADAPRQKSALVVRRDHAVGETRRVKDPPEAVAGPREMVPGRS